MKRNLFLALLLSIFVVGESRAEVTNPQNPVKVNQGSAAALSSMWPVQITDGTNLLPTGDSSARSIHTTIDNTPLPVILVPTATSGATSCNLQSTASTNSTLCKASAGTLYGYEIINTTATLYYLRFYDLSAAPICSSATGYIRSIPIPASTTGAGIERDMSMGEAYQTGIGFCLTGGGSSGDNTNAAVGVYLSLLYK